MYIHVPKPHREKESKFVSRAHKGVFVEYDSSQSWRVYDLERKCFDVSHDVTFLETEFPKVEDFPRFGPASLQQGMENPDPTRFLQDLRDPGAGRSRFAPASVATRMG